MTFEQDNQIIKRPKCAVKNCEGEGWILVGNKFVCSKCAIKFNEIQNKMIFNMIEDLEEKDGNINLS